MEWSLARERYERQGLLVEEHALVQAEQECLADAAARERRRVREAERHDELDRDYVAALRRPRACPVSGLPAGSTRSRLPNTPVRKYSDRVSHSAAAGLGAATIELAVIAHIRHTETNYDVLLAAGVERRHARDQVHDTVRRVLARWRRAPGS